MRRARPHGRAPRVAAPALAAVLAATLVLSGCGALFGSRYNNFRAYYNTFFNARKAFEDGERGLERPNERIDRTRFLSLFPAGQAATVATASAGGAGGSAFQTAIDKSADLLRERPDSKYVDDALLLIGKSYFYTGNFVGAEQKFREAIAAGEERRARGLVDEARFWLGRTLGASRRFEEGAEVLRTTLVAEGVSRRWQPRIQLALGELYADARDWEQAVTALRAGLADVRDDDLAARGEFLLGQVLEAAGRPAEAAEAYGASLAHNPVYELAYAAELNRALVLGLGAGETEGALELLRRMRRADKHYPNRAEVELAYARVLAAAGQTDLAQERYEAVLYDRTLNGTTIRGEALYRYAEFYRTDVRDFVRAAAYFDSAAATARTEPGREELVTAAALTGVRRTADVYRAYADLATNIHLTDSLLVLGSLDEAEFRARIAAIEAARRQTWQEDQRRLAIVRAGAGFGDVTLRDYDPGAGGVGGAGVRGEEGDGGVGGTGAGTSASTAVAGFLGYLDISRIQQAQIAFEQLWGDRPLVPNWRRRTAIGGAPVAGAQGIDPTRGPEGATDLDGPPPLDLSHIPRTAEAQAILRTERAGLRYEIGNVLFLSMANPDSAAYWYRLVVEEDTADAVSYRALYALAEAERARGREAEADPLYRRVIELSPESDLADQARERLGLAAREAAADDDGGEAAYADARGRAARGDYARAVGDLLALAVADPEADVAPQALLSAGAFYTEWAYRDSLDLWAMPDSLVPAALRPAADSADGAAPAPAAGDEVPGDEVIEEVPADEMAAPTSEGADEARGDEREGEIQMDAAGEEKPEDEAASEGAPTPPGALVPPSPVAPPPAAPDPVTPEVMEAAAPDVATETAAAPVTDSLGATVDAFGLDDLYAYVAAQYPGTPYAERARALGSLLADRRPVPDVVPAADTTGAAPPDSAAVAAVPVADPSRYGLQGEGAIDASIGGYAWRVATVPTPMVARAQFRNFARRGFHVGVVARTDGESTLYDILIGQFATPADAEAARGDLPSIGFSADYRLIPLQGATVLGEVELDQINVD